MFIILFIWVHLLQWDHLNSRDHVLYFSGTLSTSWQYVLNMCISSSLKSLTLFLASDFRNNHHHFPSVPCRITLTKLHLNNVLWAFTEDALIKNSPVTMTAVLLSSFFKSMSCHGASPSWVTCWWCLRLRGASPFSPKGRGMKGLDQSWVRSSPLKTLISVLSRQLLVKLKILLIVFLYTQRSVEFFSSYKIRWSFFLMQY